VGDNRTKVGSKRMEFRRSSDSSNAENLEIVTQLLYKYKI